MNWFKNLRTVTKLMLAFAVMAAAMAFVGYRGISTASTLNAMMGTLYQRDMLGISAMKQADIERVRIGRDTRAAMIAASAADKQQISRNIDKGFETLHQELAKVEKTITTDENRARMATIKEGIPQYEAAVKETLRLTIANDAAGAAATLSRAGEIARQLDPVFRGMCDTKEQVGNKAHEDSAALFESERNTLITVLAISILGSLGLGYFIARLIARPLTETVGVLDKVAQGDLTARLDLDTRDEVGRMAESLNHATEAMQAALNEVRVSAESMASSAQELAASSEELAAGAQEQASSLEETTATLEQITSTVKQNADNAKQANQVANGSRDTAEKGGQVVSDAVAAMGQINESSKNIAEIITTIDEIAFQTNLLALNAAVEAARAGEQGRGFAVVATEVRNLAQRSASSAKEIKRLIQDSVRKVENGSELVNKSGETLHEIVSSVKRVTDIVAEIAAASREQSTGIEQVNKAMIQMDQVTQTNSSQTEELSATAQSLSAHAQQLQSLVSRFRLSELGAPRQVPVQVTAHPVAPAQPVRRVHVSKPALAAAPGVKPNGHTTSDASAFQDF